MVSTQGNAFVEVVGVAGGGQTGDSNVGPNNGNISLSTSHSNALARSEVWIFDYSIHDEEILTVFRKHIAKIKVNID